MPRYTYVVKGTAASDQTWEVSGDLFAEGVTPAAITDALRLSFNSLTGGRAVYGKPGEGCQGPYKIDSFRIDRIESSERRNP